MMNSNHGPAIINNVEIALFLRDRGIPAREAIFAAVDLANQGISLPAVVDAFTVDASTEHLGVVADALHNAATCAA